ncbi:hypothetical protein ELI24_08925 [Rhizobium ruizarguesonis]|uniref:hypothetical protein n=1 Tax=Rhizobium ruizarguesonis TaxID=2081791 RepID=UPI00102FB543|nr:hypothetical protein [Rhizobium ruizarguesonis]TAV98497.1 hypothetical protein ELI24_08925 [Rhizobium ruizarguesonis]
MPNLDWNMISAIANTVMASTAVVAAGYALMQHRHSVKLQEHHEILDLYRTSTELHSKLPKKEYGEDHIEAILNLFDVHERLIADGLLSERAERFYRDFISIGSAEDADFLRDVRAMLKGNQQEYRHLIVALKKNAKTQPFTEW